MPPASDPKRLQIMQAVATRLRAITAGSTYWYTVPRSASVQLDVGTRLIGFKSVDLPGFCVQAVDSAQAVPEGAGYVKDTCELLVMGRMDADGGSAGDKRVIVGEKLAADIETTLMAVERLGLPTIVNDIRPLAPEVVYDAGPGLAVYVGVRVRVSFKRRLGQP